MTESRPTPFEQPTDRETSRVASFSDGVLAVIITIMAFELKAPADASFAALHDTLPGLLIYVLSFSFVGIYWNNHHHLLRATTRVSGWVMWANLHLLFWLSLIPVTTEWVGKSYDHALPAAIYATVALAAALAYTFLVQAIVRTEGRDSHVATALKRDTKGQLSTLAYAAGVGLAFVSPWITYALLVMVALAWFVPDRRLGAAG